MNAEGEIVVAALGDSIHAGSPHWDPDPAVRERIGDELDERSQWEYWAARADRACVSATAASTASARTRSRSASTRASKARTSSSSRAASTTSPSTGTSLQRQRTCGSSSAAAAARPRVAIADVLPWNNGWPRAADPIARLNELIAALAAARACPCCPSTRRSRARTRRAGCATSGPPTATIRPSRATGGSASSPSACHERLRVPLHDRNAAAGPRARRRSRRTPRTGASTAGAPSPTTLRPPQSTRRSVCCWTRPARR